MASSTVHHLVEAPNNLWYRINVLIHDLRRFKDNDEARNRLEQVTDPIYIGSPYFSASEANLIKETIVDTKSQKTLHALLVETLEAKLQKKQQTKDFQLCTGHDLAPIFEEALGVDHKKLTKSKAFIKLVTKSGLTLAANERFKGTGKQQAPP